MLVVFHKNPKNLDDPTEFGHHIRLHGLAYRKEMWGLPDYAETVDMELRDLERYYARTREEDYGVHPLAEITEHYFEAPASRMQSFAPDYIFDQMGTLSAPSTTDGAMRMTLDVVATGIRDAKECLASSAQRRFPCRGMTGLSTDSIQVRGRVMGRMKQQTQRMRLVSSRPLDQIRQLLTDRASELEPVREAFVNHALVEANVPEIMRQRTVSAAIKRGMLKGKHWI